MKLKTLKEIFRLGIKKEEGVVCPICKKDCVEDEWYPVFCCEDCNWNSAMTLEDIITKLKQEAIRWIKEIYNRQPEFEPDPYECDEANYKFNLSGEDVWLEWTELEQIVRWIKHFFNITEEDLK